MTKITIHDVAREASVSIGTVYRAVNNSGRISEKTRQRVLDTVSRLGYKPNTVARGLALRTKFTIAVFLPQQPDFFWHDIIRGVNQAASELSEYGVRLLTVYHSDRSDPSRSSLEILKSETVDAIVLAIVSLADGRELLKFASDHAIPVAVVNEDTATRDRLFFYGPDNHLAGRMAAELMMKFCLPNSRCCIISTPGTYGESTLSYRHDGFLDYFSKQNHSMTILEPFTCSIEESPKLVQQLLAQRPEIDGFYFDQSSTLIRCAALFANCDHHPVVIGHEFCSDLEPFLLDGSISALLVQDKVCQGYEPVKLIYQYLMLGELPAQTQLFSNIHIMIQSNMAYLKTTNRQSGCLTVTQPSAPVRQSSDQAAQQ